MIMNAKAKAIVLFGHGARDVRWREPFDRLASLWKAQHPNVLVELAFLELMQPSLEEAIAVLVDGGATEVVVVPVFFGQGGHCRRCQKFWPYLLDPKRRDVVQKFSNGRTWLRSFWDKKWRFWKTNFFRRPKLQRF
jgi:sirohydrochlorin cobaltochelatase